MQRQALNLLKQWSQNPTRKPLLIRGARQVGKTYIVEQLGKTFDTFVAINFELSPHFQSCFRTLDPQAIINQIGLLAGTAIKPGTTLLFLDEIQACPKAIESLRYFREQCPELHVIAAGSLLEFALHRSDISMPVGRVEYLNMGPCSFEEFLINSEQQGLLDLLNNMELGTRPTEAIHQHLLTLFHQYMAIGGMPEAMDTYLKTHDHYAVQRVQNSILQTYRDDFGKYASEANHKYLEVVYDKAPGMLGQQISYSKIDPDFRARELKHAINLLEYAGVVKHIYACSASGLPLSSSKNNKKFKLHFLDVGLAQRKSGLETALLMNEDIFKINAGGLAEQVVAQELLAYQDPFDTKELFYWARDQRGAQAEVDYVTNFHRHIIPIEVKSSALGHLKSLRILMQEKQLPLGMKISNAPLSLEDGILSLPMYMVKQLPRLVKGLP